MRECEYLIVGGGLAGMSLAHALSLRMPGREVVVLEAGEPGAEASSAPQAMMHPLPGLSLAPKTGYLKAFHWTQGWLQSWSDLSSKSLLWKTSLLRPLWPNDPASSRLLRSFQTHQSSYSNVVEGELLSAEQTSSWHTHQAIKLTPAYGVAMPSLLEELKLISME